LDSKYTGSVTYRLESHNPPILTKEEWRVWEERQQMLDKANALQDISPLPSIGMRHFSELAAAKTKQQITLRLDADVLQFFRSEGRRYQTRINAALREFVAAQKKAV
jgi:uncharacterized protein (DUF4415 family)